MGIMPGIGRVVLSREGENVSLVVLVAWMRAWKLWVRGRFLSVVYRVGAGSVKALRGPRDLLRRSSPSRIFYRPRPYPSRGCSSCPRIRKT